MTRARIAVAALAAAVAVTTPAPAPASAPTAAVYTGTIQIGCHGCGTAGPAGNTLRLGVNGVVDGADVSSTYPAAGPPNATASFTVNIPGGLPCLLGVASGTLTVLTAFGPKSTTATWTWIGSTGVMSIPGWHATATITFVGYPYTAPCGLPASAYVSGEMWG